MGKLVAALCQRLVHAPPAGHCFDLGPDRGHQITPRLQRELFFFGGAAGQRGHALPDPDQPRRPARIPAQKLRDPCLGLIRLCDQPAIAVHGGKGLLEPPFVNGKAPFVGFDLDGHLRRTARMGAQGGDLFVARAEGFEEQRLYRVEKRGFAVLVRLAQDIDPVAYSGHLRGVGEAADVVKGDRADLHAFAPCT